MKLSANHLFGKPIINKTEIKLRKFVVIRKLEKCSTNACVVALCFQLSSKSYNFYFPVVLSLSFVFFIPVLNFSKLFPGAFVLQCL